MNNLDQNNLFFAGIDVGSLSTKAVLLNGQGIQSHCTIPTGSNPRQAGERAFQSALDLSGLGKEQVSYAVGTGYGRINLPFVNRTVTELTCHAKGAHYLNPQVRTVIDIGGQDSKVIQVDSRGNMVDFAMNDKCAAGTGRFLEVMAKALEISLEDIGHCALQSRNPCSINNTCAVFAESEVISLLASGNLKHDIAAGLHAAVAQRIGNMVKRIGLAQEVVFVGGVAKNIGAKKALEDFLEIRFSSVAQDPQLNGALGAAVLAREIFLDQRRRDSGISAGGDKVYGIESQ